MEHQDDIRKELDELAPRLSRLKKENPFQVPDYYFQGLPDKVLERVKNEPQPWTERMENGLNRIFALIFQPRYALTFATCLVVLAVSIGFLKNRETAVTPAAPQLSQISTEAIDAYILNDFDDYELVAFNGVNSINLFPAGEKHLIPAGISDDDLNDYLNDNIDNQTLEEEYL